MQGQRPHVLVTAVAVTVAAAAVLLLLCTPGVHATPPTVNWYPCPVESRVQVNGGSTSTAPPASDLLRRRRIPSPPQEQQDSKDGSSSTKGRGKRDVFSSLTSLCASTPVPLDWTNTSDANYITVFAKCYTTTGSTGQLWMLQGGPGASSWPMETLMANVFALTQGKFDLCTTDFRGVDRSSLYTCQATGAQSVGSAGGCNIEPSETKACADELDNLASVLPVNDGRYYTTTQAAQDVNWLVQSKIATQAEVVLYGGSYGTLWLARIAELFPHLASAWIFDSVANPSNDLPFDFANFDSQFDSVMKNYILQSCGADSFCQTKVTTDPVGFANTLYSSLFASTSSCPAVVTNGLVPTQADLNTLLYTLSTADYTRPLIPAVLYRLNRCDSDDAAIVNWLVYSLVNTPNPVDYCDTTMNNVLYNQVVSAELFNVTGQVTVSQINTETSLSFSPAASLQIYETRLNWTSFTDNSVFTEVDKLVNITAPVLILSGNMDTQTPLDYGNSFADYLKTSLSLTNVFNGTALNKGHIVVTATDSNFNPCGYSIVANFALDPTTQPDMACLSDIYWYTWAGNTSYNYFFVNTTDIYDGIPSSGPISATPFIIALIVVAIVAAGLLVTIIIMAVQSCFARKAAAQHNNSIPLS